MDGKKFQLILNRLLEQTENEKLEWKSTGAPDTFLLVLKESSVSITEGFSEDTGMIYELQFRNEKGEIVETVFNKDLERLFKLARGKALNSDKTIDRILEQLSPESTAV